jgi:tRNA (cytidine32/uridine32-2'-O)-methyltransferase
MNPINQFVQIVLVETSHPGNIGSVARAMKNMGLSNLVLINPKKFRERTIEWPVATARDAAQEINQLAAEGLEVSILFGREDRGLTNEELQLSNKHLIIPADPDYPVLNIAMSTQVVCYELYQASQKEPIGPWQDFPEYTSEELTHLIEHFNETVYNLKLVDPNNPKQILTRMERMFRRLYPDQMEGNFLRGFFKEINNQIK